MRKPAALPAAPPDPIRRTAWPYLARVRRFPSLSASAAEKNEFFRRFSGRESQVCARKSRSGRRRSTQLFALGPRRFFRSRGPPRNRGPRGRGTWRYGGCEMSFSWMSRLFQGRSADGDLATNRCTGTRRGRSGFRPELLALEDRVVPAVNLIQNIPGAAFGRHARSAHQHRSEFPSSGRTEHRGRRHPDGGGRQQLGVRAEQGRRRHRPDQPFRHRDSEHPSELQQHRRPGHLRRHQWPILRRLAHAGRSSLDPPSCRLE